MGLINYIGYGELTWDKNYDTSLSLIKENGGGTTWNILSNLASFDSREKVIAIGVVGNDECGNSAVESLRQRGVDVQYIEKKEKNTNTVYSIIPKRIDSSHNVKYSMYSPITGELKYQFSEELPKEIQESLREQDSVIIIENFRQQNLEFINQFKSKKVAMDIGRKKVLQGYTKEYMMNFLQNINLCLISREVLQELYSKLQIGTLKELTNIMNPDLMIITNGEKDTFFIYKKNREYTFKRMHPELIEDVIDPTGAGDCFFSVIISNYTRCWKNKKEIDEEFVDKVFPLASKLSGEVIKQIGGRCELETIKKAFGKVIKDNKENLNLEAK